MIMQYRKRTYHTHKARLHNGRKGQKYAMKIGQEKELKGKIQFDIQNN
jgi:hypothetical protein